MMADKGIMLGLLGVGYLFCAMRILIGWILYGNSGKREGVCFFGMFACGMLIAGVLMM